MSATTPPPSRPLEPSVDASSALPDEAYLTVLAALPAMGPRRLLALSLLAGPAEAWHLVTSGRSATLAGLAERMGPDPAALARRWSAAAAAVDVDAAWARHSDVTVAGRSHPLYPEPLRSDLEPPAVVFMDGTPTALVGPRVAVVGTRNCTRVGRDLAAGLAADLSLAGVHVVSGLALGIDGAAHRGALDGFRAGGAPPVAVVASGLDVVYPPRNRELWADVATHGLILSECPLGTAPEAWRFPARNRVVAALSQAVVVVETGPRGGSMYTVAEALRRDVPVLAVPGPVGSPASTGTNQLIFDGAAMARDARDVLAHIGLSVPTRRVARESRPRPSPRGRIVLRAMGWEPVGLDDLAVRVGFDVGELAVVLADLQEQGWITRGGLWFERVGGR